MQRRRFLTLATGSLAGYGLFRALSKDGSAANHAPAVSSEMQRVERHSYALGSEVSIIALHADRALAEKALGECFDELELIESIMSIYRSQSQLSQLNASGILNKPHPYFVEVLKASQAIAEKSGGAFDITVQPLWALYSQAKKERRLPGASEIAAAMSKVDWRKLKVSSDCVHFAERGMAITLNGVAQGFATDRVSAILKKNGIADALINTGEIGSLGHKAENDSWRVGVQHPRQADALSAVVALDGRCLSTSGDYATCFSDDFVHNHIFDPATGDSPREFSSVSVLANNGTTADALSTAVFVCGMEKGIALLEKHQADAFLISKDGLVHRTANFPTAS
jgi:FAD:protein FMN transferase